MARSIFAGMTDYSHQSFNDILEDLKSGEEFVTSMIETIENSIQTLEASKYWQKLPYNFKSIILYSLKHYKTTKEELNNIHNEIQRSVQEHHCNRLERIAKVGGEINISIGKYWNGEYEGIKDYENSDFMLVDLLYCDTRDTAVSLLNYSNIAQRLKDFIGKTSYDMENKPAANFGSASFGDNVTIVVGNHNVTNPTQIKKNDLNALEKLLLDNQVKKEEIEELKEILQSEEPDREKKILGTKANGWIAKMVSKSLDGTWAIGIGAAGKLLADGIKYYYGLFEGVH